MPNKSKNPVVMAVIYVFLSAELTKWSLICTNIGYTKSNIQAFPFWTQDPHVKWPDDFWYLKNIHIYIYIKQVVDISYHRVVFRIDLFDIRFLPIFRWKMDGGDAKAKQPIFTHFLNIEQMWKNIYHGIRALSP